MGSMSVSSCRCCMFVYCVHPVAGSSQCRVLHDLQFVDAGRGYKRRPYGRGILHSRSDDCFIVSHECLILFTHPVAVSAFIICSGLCACTEML